MLIQTILQLISLVYYYSSIIILILENSIDIIKMEEIYSKLKEYKNDLIIE